MYKETLDILLEDINDHNDVKTQLLKNQLEYHFTTKDIERQRVLDCSVPIVRRVVDRFRLADLIGVQPITNEKNPTVISGGLKYDVALQDEPYKCSYPDLAEYSMLEGEINQAIGHEIESEIVSTYLNIIAEYAPEITFTLTDSWERESLVALADTIEEAIYEIGANWIVVSPLVLSLIQSNPEADYNQDSTGEKKFTMGDLQLIGSFNGVPTYCSLHLPNDGATILIGYKDHESEDAPIVFAPKTLIQVGFKARNDFDDPYYPLSSRQAKFIHIHNVEDQYRKITIKYDDGVDI